MSAVHVLDCPGDAGRVTRYAFDASARMAFCLAEGGGYPALYLESSCREVPSTYREINALPGWCLLREGPRAADAWREVVVGAAE